MPDPPYARKPKEKMGLAWLTKAGPPDTCDPKSLCCLCRPSLSQFGGQIVVHLERGARVRVSFRALFSVWRRLAPLPAMRQARRHTCLSEHASSRLAKGKSGSTSTKTRNGI